MAKRFCTGCGAEIPEGERFCTACGQRAPEPAAAPAYSVASPPPPASSPQQSQSFRTPPPPPPVYGGRQQGGRPPQNSGGQNSFDAPPEGKYAPITTLGWIGIMLLLMIPIVNFILLVVWACGGCAKVTKRSFARASLIGMAVGLVLSLILGFAAKQAFASIVKNMGFQDMLTSSIAEEFGVDPSVLKDFDLSALEDINSSGTGTGGASTDVQTGQKEAQALLDMLKNP